MSLRLSYTLLAPFYDLFAGPAFDAARRASLAALPREGSQHVLLNGVGSGLDLPLLPRGHTYVGLDVTRAMLKRCRQRSMNLDFAAVQASSLELPFKDARFDCAVLHLILAVVPDAGRALAETARVVRPGGSILIFDKFLKKGNRALVRRMFSPLVARVATRLDVVFEEALAQTPALQIVSDKPAAAGGWFRLILLRKR